MKSLEDFKEEIHRCSKCGLCQAVCPLYEITGNECTVSRGQFIMLDGVVKKDLKMNKNINKYLDICLKCGKCSGFCPSNIDIVEILLHAKHEYFKKSLSGTIYKILESKFVFNNLLKILKLIGRFFCKKKKSKSYEKKAIYFGGCISKLRPDVDNYIIDLLNEMRIEVLETDFNCCGMPFLTTGNLERFQEQAIENIKKIDNDIDYLIMDCASCEWAWKQYSKYIDDETLKEKLSKICFKNIYDFIAESDLEFISKTKKVVTYHKPCHQESIDNILKIISKCKNIEYKEMDGHDKCCGFASFEHPQTLNINNEILKEKRKNIKSVKADFVLTTCVGCLISLNIITLFHSKIQRLLTFLKDECNLKD